MSSKVAHYLQEHLLGEVMTTPDARRYFATDGSILTVTPALVAYPRGENDVRKTARFAWQLAERGRIVPITARGAGTNQTGAALGDGIVLALMAHMHRILEFDDKSGVVVVEPGAIYGKVQQVLKTHGRFLPPYPASVEYSTIGGAVANNAGGEKSIKYGTTRDYVKSLRVVLANGEIIETGRLNKRDLNKKLGLATFEGEIYRAIDVLLEENQKIVNTMWRDVSKNAAGYALGEVKRKDGSFDLTPLFVGAQGTLGLITEITLETEAYNPDAALFLAYFDDHRHAQSAITALRALPDMPSAVEMVNRQLLELVDRLNPNQLKDVITKPFPGVALLVEFDNAGDRSQKKLIKKAGKIFGQFATDFMLETDPLQQERLWKIRRASSLAAAHGEGNAKPLPIIEDGIVPADKLAEYIDGVYAIFDRYQLQAVVWGHAGDANLHMQPALDLAQVGDRQKLFRIMDEYYDLVIGLGGSISAEHGDGRLHAPYLEKLYGSEAYGLLQKVKTIFDPYNILNPGVKINVGLDDVKPLLRQSYGLEHLYGHLPQS